MSIAEIIQTALNQHPGEPIRIISGEGERGTAEDYTGKRTGRAIMRRLTRERCGGDRWAWAALHFDERDDGPDVALELEQGCLVDWPEVGGGAE